MFDNMEDADIDLYITPSPMTLPMKQPKTAMYAQKPPSGATGGGISEIVIMILALLATLIMMVWCLR